MANQQKSDKRQKPFIRFLDPGELEGWITAYHDSPMAPNCLSHPLDPTSEALFPRLEGAIRLLIKDTVGAKLFVLKCP